MGLRTREEIKEIARKAKAKTGEFGTHSSDKFARESKGRLDAFCRRVKGR